MVLINLLVMNDWMSLWSPWETEGNGLTKLFGIGEGTPPKLFLVRLPGVLFLILGLGLSYWVGKPIFGRSRIIQGGLVLCTSFVLLFCTKLMVFDTWLLVSQSVATLAMIRYMKQPALHWVMVFWAATLLALFIHPWSTVLALVVLGISLRILHLQGKQLDKLCYWLLPVLLFVSPIQQMGFIFSFGNIPYWQFLGLMFLGLLPWTGFLMASFADLIYKLRKREEMAIILLGMLLAGIFAQSLLLTMVFALLIARQLAVYFQENYPYRSLVRGFAVLHLLGSFFVITFLLLNAYTTIGGVGFRAIMAAGAVYWMLTFIGVIGLFGNQKRLIMVGMTWGALVTFFLLVVRTYPVLAPHWFG